MSSLSDQLKARTTLDSTKLSTTTSIKTTTSFIFTSKHAASLTLQDLHTLTLTAWDQLASIDKFFELNKNFTKILGEEIKNLNRINLTKEENENLNKVLNRTMRELSKHALTKPAGIVLEWLIRRFRIQDLNIPSLIALFLPYHTTSHFPSALALISPAVLQNTIFSSLSTIQKSLQPVPLPALIELLPPFSRATNSRELMNFFLRLPLTYLEETNEKVGRSMIGFWLQFWAGYLERAATASTSGKGKVEIGEQNSILAVLLETLSEARKEEDLLIATQILLGRFCITFKVKDEEELKVILKTLVINRLIASPLGASSTIGNGVDGGKEVDKCLLNHLILIPNFSQEVIEIKEGKKFLGNSGWKNLLRIPDLAETLIELCNSFNGEKFMKPFLHTLVSESHSHSTSLTTLTTLLNPITTASSSQTFLPSQVLSTLTSKVLLSLISTITEASSEPNPALIKILTEIYQRNSTIWESVTGEILIQFKEEKDNLLKLRSIINRVLSGGVFIGDGGLESESSDLTIRILALKDILTIESKVSTEVEELIIGEDGADVDAGKEFIHDVLLARLAEPVETILEILLASSEGIQKLQSNLTSEEILHTLLNTLTIISNSTKSILAQSLEKIILTYLSNSFIEKFEDKKEEVLKKVWWNRILKSKLSVATKEVLPILISSKLIEFDWIKGITGESNEEIVGKIAKNLIGLNSETRKLNAIEYLLNEIEVSSNEVEGKDVNNKVASRQLLSLLICSQLVNRLESNSKIEFVGRILDILNLENVGLDFISSTKPETILEEGALNTNLSPLLVSAIHSKSTAYNTLRRTRAALVLIAVKSLKATSESSWNWLTSSTTSNNYSELIHSIYRIAHTGTTPGTLNLASKLLQSLFTTCISAGDSLSFLTSIWTSSIEPTELKIVALKDSAVYILAMKQINKSIDFQLILPSILLTLQDQDKKVRIAGLELLRVIQNCLPTAMTEVYGKGCFYGTATSGAIKFLDIADTSRYITKLLESHVEFSMDGKYIVVFHQSVLGSNEPESKKKSSTLKSKIFHYLISHVQAWTNVQARVGILRAISGIVDGVKSGLIVPILSEFVKFSTSERITLSKSVSVEVGNEYAVLLLGPYDGVSKKWLESTDHTGLETFFKVLDISDEIGIGATLRKQALTIVKTGLFSTLRGENRLDLFKRLVKLASSTDSKINVDASDCLRVCKVDHDTVSGFLSEIRLAITTPVSKGAKRGRTSQGHANSRSERIPELIVVLESIEFKSIRASHTLVLTLFDLLSTLIEISASNQVDIQYSGQLLLSTLSKVIENVTPTSGVTADSIRMAPVLDLMRSTINPQTSHQALLLLAQLGPLVPDQLSHNIMPIFTFMGANVLQRDDAYSLRVVDRTLESIVPALVESMKVSSADRNSLVSELKKLLRVFTDAAIHVPRHRRIKLFVRFVQTLGASDFLSSVSMLLVDKAVKVTDPTSLPLAVFESFPVDVQLTAFKQIIEEISRLLSHGTEGAETSFLDIPTESTPAQNSEDAKEQVLNIISFLAISLESKQLFGKVDAARAAGNQTVDTDLSELVRNLLEVSNIKVIDYAASDKAELSVAIGYAIQATVHLMSTQSFSEALLWLLDLSDTTIQSSALALLRNRLPTIKATRRGDISPAVVSVVERIRLSLSDSATNIEQALVTLEVVANSVWSEEDTVLAKSVPDLLVLASSTSTTPKATKLLAMSIIKKLANRLGPRLIPLASKITPFAVEILRSEAKDPLTTSQNMVAAAFEVLEGLFTSIPTFIGTQLDKVLEACLSSDIMSLTTSSDSVATKARAVLLSTAAKRVPAKSLYPSIIRLHASLDLSTKEPLLGLLDVLNRALRQGKTTEIAENYRPVFKLFLTIFDLRRIHPASLDLEDINQIEENALGAFVQFILKLNEQTFRPLFLRTYDWAVIDLANEVDATVALTARRIVLYKLVDRLLTQLKSIFVPYYSFMLDQTVELLESFASGEASDVTLWTSVTSALTKSLLYDETGFWTPLRLGKLSTPISNQLQSPSTSTTTLLTTLYNPLIAAYANALATHENLLKNFNSSLLMLTRSDDLKIKRSAVETIEQVWMELNDVMLGFVAETVPFLSETVEETDGGVEQVTRRLISRIENGLGETLQDYLDN